MNQEIQRHVRALEPLCVCLLNAETTESKLKILDVIPYVNQMRNALPQLEQFIQEATPEQILAIKEVLVLGQGDNVFGLLQADRDLLEKTVESLVDVDKFYDSIGGIVGYHLTILKLIIEKNATIKPETTNYYKPEGEDIFHNQKEARNAVRWAIEKMDEMAEIYPIGGAGDRLNLIDEETNEPLPVAQLEFCGRSLLSGMVRDLQGREYLHYKLTGKQLTTPIAMMTSPEKNNHEKVQKMCEENQWFGRPQESFRLFIQPMVPVITKDGDWAMLTPTKLGMKPGGHGVIWKRAIDEGIFDWFKDNKRNKALVRQINNPVAGTDNGLLALTGIGCEKNKDFGFASCPRLLNTSEGMNVLVEKKFSDGYQYAITNIEYTDFEQKGIKDVPETPGSAYSVFPSNTNILFIDLEAVRAAVDICPIPGMIVNMKTSISCFEKNGPEKIVPAGRLESTMQNIADYIVDKIPEKLPMGDRKNLRTFLIYNERRKTLSVTKQSYVSGKSLVGTPEGCFYEIIENYHDLLSNYCHFHLPPLNSSESYLLEGPSFIADFHPALGGVFEVIGQKVRGGSVAKGSEWMMEIAEVDVENLRLDGSLLIEAENITGKRNEEGVIVYSSDCGKCVLKNVEVKNKGINYSNHNTYWKHKVERLESLQIILKGNGEFVAENVKFNGDFRIEVPDGKRVTAYMNEGEVAFHSEEIERPSWQWEYTFDAQNRIMLKSQDWLDRL